jgi:HK97 family phage major capsid protein
MFGQEEQLSRLTVRRDALRTSLDDQLSAAQRDGRRQLSAAEKRALAEYEGLTEQIADLQADISRAGGPELRALSERVNQPSARSAKMRDTNLVYRKDNRHQVSWLRDLFRLQTQRDDTGESRRRLLEHADQVGNDPAYLEYRDLSRIDGQGGYAVPPIWLMDQYVELARPGRAFANLCAREELPGGTDSINIPKVLTGTTVGIQTADNQPISDTDLTDTYINAPVRTIAGQQQIAIQVLDQSPIDFSNVVFKDLIAAYATQVDLQVMAGNGSSGQVLGVDLTPNINTISVSEVTIQGVYSAIANAIQTIHTTRFLPPEVIVMHPRRWGWMLASFDDAGRPLFLPHAQAPMNVGGVLTDVASQQVVGTMHGLPVVTDPSITIANGAETPVGDEDIIYVGRFSDLLLWESGVRARVLPEVAASTLTVTLQVFGYLAFSAARYPQSICQVVGLTPPTF